MTLLAVACLPAWVARSALATIGGDEDAGAGEHVLAAVLPFALALAMTEIGLRAWERPRVARWWRHAAALLLLGAWLPSAASLPLAAEVALTAAVALAGGACSLRAISTGRR